MSLAEVDDTLRWWKRIKAFTKALLLNLYSLVCTLWLIPSNNHIYRAGPKQIQLEGTGSVQQMNYIPTELTINKWQSVGGG